MTTPPSGPGTPVMPSWRSRYLAAVLDAIVPGLGHLVAGRRRLAAFFGIPFLALVLASLLLVATTSVGRLAAEAVNVFWPLLAVQGVVLAWRLLSAGTSLVAPNLPRLRARDALPIAILLLLLAGPQIVLGHITNAARTASDAIFVGNGEPPGGWQPQGSAAPDPGDFGSAAPFASAEPSSSPSAGPQRITILLMGVDSWTGGTPRLPTR